MSDETILRVGTRASALATAQSGLVADRLTAATGLRTELVPVKTEGDTNRTAPLTSFGGQGVFISALRDALRSEERRVGKDWGARRATEADKERQKPGAPTHVAGARTA